MLGVKYMSSLPKEEGEELQESETEEEVERRATSKLIGLRDPLCICHGLFTLSMVLSSDRQHGWQQECNKKAF